MSITAESQQLYDAKALLTTHGTECTYQPESGDERAIVASLGPFQNVPTETGRSLNDAYSVWVFVLRDAGDADFGGINNPQLGDALTIDSEDAGETLAYTGSMRNRDRYSVELEFARNLPRELGGHRR